MKDPRSDTANPAAATACKSPAASEFGDGSFILLSDGRVAVVAKDSSGHDADKCAGCDCALVPVIIEQGAGKDGLPSCVSPEGTDILTSRRRNTKGLETIPCPKCNATGWIGSKRFSNPVLNLVHSLLMPTPCSLCSSSGEALLFDADSFPRPDGLREGAAGQSTQPARQAK